METESVREREIEKLVSAFQYPNKDEWNDKRIREEMNRLLPWEYVPALSVSEEEDVYETHSGEPIYAPISREMTVTYVDIDCGRGKTAHIEVLHVYGDEL